MEEMVEQTILTSGRKDLDLLEEILAWHGLVKEQKKKKKCCWIRLNCRAGATFLQGVEDEVGNFICIFAL